MTRRIMLAVVAIAVVAPGLPALAQEPAGTAEPAEPSGFVHPTLDRVLEGFERGDGIIVLSDEAFCRYLIASIWGRSHVVDPTLLPPAKRSGKRFRRSIENNQYRPAIDKDTVRVCADALNQFRLPQRESDPMPEWSLDRPVVPAALADFLQTLDGVPVVGDGPFTDLLEDDLGRTRSAGTADITVVDVDWSPDSDVAPTDGFEWVAVLVRYDANGDGVFQNPAEWDASDRFGFTYRASTLFVQPALFFGELRDGKRSQGWLTFEVPRMTDWLELVVTPPDSEPLTWLVRQ